MASQVGKCFGATGSCRKHSLRFPLLPYNSRILASPPRRPHLRGQRQVPRLARPHRRGSPHCSRPGLCNPLDLYQKYFTGNNTIQHVKLPELDFFCSFKLAKWLFLPVTDAGLGNRRRVVLSWRDIAAGRSGHVGDEFSSHQAQDVRALLLYSPALCCVPRVLLAACWHTFFLPDPPWCLPLHGR